MPAGITPVHEDENRKPDACEINAIGVFSFDIHEEYPIHSDVSSLIVLLPQCGQRGIK